MTKLCACGESSPAKFAPLSKKECLACKAARRARRVKPASPKARERAQRLDGKKHPEHLAWVRTQPCAIYLCGNRDMHAHHVRVGTGGGTGAKPSDRFCVPLCGAHHHEGHQKGWKTFEAKYHVDLRALAERLAKGSPAL